MQFVIDNQVAIIAALLAVSELLAFVPSIKANSLFQAIFNGIKALAKKPE